MARLYSQQFGIAKDVTGKDWGGPDPDDIWIIRQVTAYSGNASSSGTKFQMYETVSGVVFLQFSWNTGGLTDEIGTFFFDGRIVLPPGQELSWRSFADAGASGVDVYIGGYVLQGP